MRLRLPFNFLRTEFSTNKYIHNSVARSCCD